MCEDTHAGILTCMCVCVGVFWIDWKSVCTFYDVLYINWKPDIFKYKRTVHE